MRERWVWMTIIIFAVMIAIGVYLFLNPRQAPKITVPHKAQSGRGARVSAPATANFAVPVLMYHRVDDLNPEQQNSRLARDLTVSPNDFEMQMQYLIKSRFSVVLAGDVEKAVRDHTPLPEKAVAITFDDGYGDSFRNVYPILKRHKIPATIFVVTNNVGSSGHVTWDEVRSMSADSFACGSHSVHHADLTKLPISQLDYELLESKRQIEQQTSKPVTSIAYPAGEFNDMVIKRVAAAGYSAAWTKSGGPVTPESDPYHLPRVRIHGAGSISDFKQKAWSGIRMIKGSNAVPKNW